MDVSLPSGNHDVVCDVCGYSRRGLSDGAHCPECGDPPPKLAASPESIPRTLEELRWLRTLAIGLWLLIFASIGALQVALIMPLHELSVGAINYPGPKIFASALVQRTIGGEPGPQGVFGTLCVMLSALAVFLLTEPRILRDQHESFWSLRRRTRWISLLSIGAFSGLLLSGFDPNIAFRGRLSVNLFVLGLICCELPANTLLYLFLRDFSRQMGDRRATLGLGACVIAVPILIVFAVLLVGFGPLVRDDFTTPLRLSMMAFGAAALVVGVVGTTAVLRLACALSIAAFGGSWANIRLSSADFPRLLRRVMVKLEDQWSRWCVVAGLLLWLCSVPLCIQNVLYTPIRFAFGGDVPLLNFAGPKVSSFSLVRCAAARVDQDDQNTEPLPTSTQLTADALTLLAVWLVTATIPGVDPSPRRRWLTRYGVLAMLGASLGVVLAVNDVNSFGPSHFTLWSVVTTEAPATFLVYTYLAGLAAQLGDPILARRLGRIAWAAPVLSLAPLSCFVLSTWLHPWRISWLAAGVGAGYVTLSFAVTFIACRAVARLAWAIARQAIGEPAWWVVPHEITGAI
jgi:hypothetical protein